MFDIELRKKIIQGGGIPRNVLNLTPRAIDSLLPLDNLWNETSIFDLGSTSVIWPARLTVAVKSKL